MFRSTLTWFALWLLAPATARVWAQPSASLRITSLQYTNGGWVLDWQNSTTDTAFTVQFQDTAEDGIWRLPTAASPFPVSSNQWVDAWATNASRLYRVVSVPAAERGKVLSVEYSNTIPASLLTLLLPSQVKVIYDVALYKVDYETISPIGARTVASGALVLPVDTGTNLPLFSYQHGTITQTNEAPSTMNLETEVSVGIAFATMGYAAVVPDYLGLGDSPGLHPYHHAGSEATACVDMLRAAKTICATNGFPLNGQLFLCGYSQGGHATMALCRELEAFHTNEFQITACAPMAGAYDLSGVTAAAFLSGKPEPNPYYFLYLLAAYQNIYHFCPSLAAVLAPPYNTTLPPLMNGDTSSATINAAMPPSGDPSLILSPAFLAALRSDPRHPLRLALEDNDVYRWKPRSPMRLYQCSGDQDVPTTNATVALAYFQAVGATQVLFFDPDPGADHLTCAEPSLLAAKSWFDSFR